jgi:hypothetical protein
MKIDKPEVPLNFLLGCSEVSLENYRLARMSEAADVRKQIAKLFDKLRETDLLVQLALWFQQMNRTELKRALETEEDAAAWAKRMIRGGEAILPRLAMPPEEAKAHRVKSSVKYQQRNTAEGKCRLCPESLCRESVQYCARHLEQSRQRQRERTRALHKAPHGKHPNTLKALAEACEKRSKG